MTTSTSSSFTIPTHLDAAAIAALQQQSAQPLLAAAPFKPALFCLTDYAAGDLALKEVSTQLISAVAHSGVTPSVLHTWSLPGLDTVAAAFEGAQLAFNSTLGFGTIYYVNCDPRLALSPTARRGNAGGRFVLALLPNGVSYFTVDSGYTLSFLAATGVALYHVNLDASGSQFRSRDFFPWVVALYARHLQESVAQKTPQNFADYTAILQQFPLLGAPYSTVAVPTLLSGSVLYTDNFGNIKLNLWHDELVAAYPIGTGLIISHGDKTLEGVVSGGSFEVPNSQLAISRSSSGWPGPDGTKRFLTELFIPGQRAADKLGNPANGAKIQLAKAQQDAA